MYCIVAVSALKFGHLCILTAAARERGSARASVPRLTARPSRSYARAWWPRYPSTAPPFCLTRRAGFVADELTATRGLPCLPSDGE